MTTPIVNINGSSEEELVGQRMDIVRGLDAALKLMGAAVPHGRDYQTDPNRHTNLRAARTAHWARMDRIKDLIVFYTSEAIEIQNQGG